MTCNEMAQHASQQPQRRLFDEERCYAHVWQNCFSQRQHTAPIMALCTFGISIQPYNCGVQVTTSKYVSNRAGTRRQHHRLHWPHCHNSGCPRHPLTCVARNRTGTPRFVTGSRQHRNASQQSQQVQPHQETPRLPHTHAHKLRRSVMHFTHFNALAGPACWVRLCVESVRRPPSDALARIIDHDTAARQGRAEYGSGESDKPSCCCRA